jgi:hypothetical protein
MTSPSLSPSRRALVGGAFAASVTLASAGALADDPGAPPAPLTSIAPAPPPRARRARPSQSDSAEPQYPLHLYNPAEWTPPVVPGMPWIPTSTQRRAWYGWQNLLVYASVTTAGVAATLGGGFGDSSALFIGGLAAGGTGILLGGPIIHWAHGHTGKGFAVLGLNVGATLVSAGLGVSLACAAGGCGSSSQGIGFILGSSFGGAAGLIAAMIVDVSVLSYEEAAPVPSFSSKRSPGWTILPDLKISRELTTLGVVGRF